MKYPRPVSKPTTSSFIGSKTPQKPSSRGSQKFGHASNINDGKS